MSSKRPLSGEPSVPPKRLRVAYDEPPDSSVFLDTQISEVYKSTFAQIRGDSDLSSDDLAIIFFCGIEQRPRNSDWKLKDIDDATERNRLFGQAKVAAGGRDILETAVRNAWATKKFSEIRTAEFLGRPMPQRTHFLIESTSTQVMGKDRITVLQAWNAPYQSHCHEYLHDTMQHLRSKKPPSLYSNTMSIIQSSGSGKSRLVNEVASLVFTIPFNLRSKQETQFLAYPDPDPEIRNYLTLPGTEEVLRIRFQAFFDSLFEGLNTWLKGQNPHLGTRELAESWKSYLSLQKNRDSFYQKVVYYATTKLGTDAVQTDVEKGWSPQSLNDFIARLPTDSTEPQPVKVVIYFDEAHTLCEQLVQDPPRNINTSETPEDQMSNSDEDLASEATKGDVVKNNYSILLSVLCNYVEQELFVLFLSTASSLARLAPLVRLAPSHRATQGHHQAPFTEMPFDCAPNLKVQYGELTVEDIIDPKFVSQFGRPYYYTFLQDQQGKAIDTIVHTLLHVLRTKLLHSVDLDDFSPRGSGALAVADVRLCLQYEPHVEAHGGKTMDLVASHMRTAFSVPIHREYLRSGYPSEPMLAEAAAQQMDTWRTQQETAPLYEILQKHLEHGLLDRGERGEVIARALVTEAYDRAVRIENLKSTNALKFSEGCSLIGFLRQLFPSEMADKVLDSMPANIPKGKGQTLMEISKKARVRFTHFSKAVDDHVFSQHAMTAAFIRGFAFICRNGERDVDMVIPILMDTDVAIEPCLMTGILIQVKRRKYSGKYHFDAEKDLEFFTAPQDDVKLPYLALVMDLGVQQYLPSYDKIPATKALENLKMKLQKKFNMALKEMKNEGTGKGKEKAKAQVTQSRPFRDADITPRVSNKHGVTVATQPRMSLRHYTSPHPCYWIHAVGCTDKTYAVISPKENQVFVNLLRLQEFLFEHPRPNGLIYVQKQKPFFAAGEQSYHWLNCDVLNPTVESLRQAEADVDMDSSSEEEIGDDD